MPLTSVSDWDGTTAANNTDLAGLSLVEGVTKPSDVNNLIRELMKQVKGAGFSSNAYTPGGTDVAVADGGTNISSYTAGDILYASAATTLTKLAKGTAFQRLRMNSGATAPEWATPTEFITIPISDETTAITTGDAKVTFRMPYAFTLTGVRASLSTASSSGLPTFDINEAGSTILSTKITIDANEKTSTTAATPAVISDSAIADDAEITIDIDVAGTGAKGAKITLIGYRNA
jgi:hypothetical protein